ncbi:LexA/Signal peptidase [Calocera cornea HHB12733]|uniref:Mitochondrial inner membrane protease subunit 2 n=1 Tax=Calocera cornea HHB12733 TaxID=1353952 RepID=A0A165DQI3_9BASI|nr:LexA/Signal peptidase [Calocera cornea HHB12733]
MSFFSAFRPYARPAIEVLLWVPFGMMFTQLGYSLIKVRGNSMQPTFNPDPGFGKDIVLGNRYVGRTEPTQLRRGDVVTLRDPTIPDLLITKRILALEGDVVRTLPPYPDTYVTIPPFHAWVEGDEPFRSSDSNHFGPVSLALVDSRVEAVVWPLSRARPLGGVWQAAAEEREGKPSVLDLVEGGQGQAWNPFRNELDRARRRMQRVYVHAGLVGGRRELERWMRAGGEERRGKRVR